MRAPIECGWTLRRALRTAAACAGIVLAMAVARANDPLRIPRLQFGSGFEPLAVMRLSPDRLAMLSASDMDLPPPIPEDSAGEISSCITPLPDIAQCANRSWRYAIVEVLAMQRDNQAGVRPLVIDNETNQTLLSTSDLDPAVALGGRAFYGYYGESGWGWEAGYLGVYGMTATQTLTGAETLQLAGPMASDLQIPFGAADEATAQFTSMINSGEINIFKSGGQPRGDRCGGCQGGCVVDWLGGFRYLNVTEQADLTFTCCTTEVPGPFTSSYDVATSNNLIGGQFGGRASRTWRRWAVEGWAKTGVFANLQSQSQAPIADPLNPGTPYRDARSSNGVAPAMVADLNLSVACRLTDTLALRAGYSAIWIGGVALAPNQWDFGTATDAGTTLDSSGSIFLNGLSVGLDAAW